MENDNVVLHLELNVSEVNVVLASLGKHPFDEISKLIYKIKMQGETQLKELENKQDG